MIRMGEYRDEKRKMHEESFRNDSLGSTAQERNSRKAEACTRLVIDTRLSRRDGVEFSD